MDIELIKDLINNKLIELGYELYSLKTRKERNDLVLEIVVDRVKPIDMNDIVNLTNEINTLLDKEDPIKEPYLLDISSLGAEKPLSVEKLPLYVKEYIHLHLTNPVNGINIYEGTLEEIDGNTLTLSYKDKTRTKTIRTELSNIYKVRLAIKF